MVLNKFLRYIKFDTQSDPESSTHPSTKKQFDLALFLQKELEYMGLSHVRLTENCYLTAVLNSNTSEDVPAIGFISHLDTSPETSGKNVKAQVIENYDGSEILLNKEENIVLSPSYFSELKKYKGQTIVTTDGTTLLGADNKAGIAEIMSAIQYLTENPEIKHGIVKIAFTPDEEIGRGADNFDIEKFGCQYAYTVDGGELGELEFENFNAAYAKITVKGRNIHPGTAKNRMINSMHVAAELDNMLPAKQRPEHTEGYEGFFHLIKTNGDVAQTKAEYIIRDHDFNEFEKKKDLFADIVNKLNNKYGENTVSVEIKDQYYNMRKQIEPVFHIIEKAKIAMLAAGVEPNIKPIRGGTDGSRLSYMGLPCPNIFTGGHNFHGLHEFIPVQSMEKAVKVIVNIIKEFAK